MVKDDSTQKECACTQRLRDLLRAAQPAKGSSLIKVTCADCGKAFWANSERKYCFDCEIKRRK
ncbi:MAG: hypothetical protein ACLFU9_02150 [Candidatus Bathyarchaeia archaeon]